VKPEAFSEALGLILFFAFIALIGLGQHLAEKRKLRNAQRRAAARRHPANRRLP
jgi:hypothetical protein